MAPRPRLKPYYRVLRRSPDAVQLGASAELGAVTIGGVGADEVRLLTRLTEPDPPRPGPARAALLSELASRGLLIEHGADRATLSQIPDSVREGLRPDAGVLALAYGSPTDGLEILHARTRQAVAVRGRGALATALARALRSDGIGQVVTGPLCPDPLDVATALPVRRSPDLAVLVTHGALAPPVADLWHRAGVPQLPVVADGARVVVGPLLGGDSDLPCHRCLDLHRCDRDPQWPYLLAQLARDSPEVAGESALTRCAAALAAMLVHAHLDGWELPDGVSLEIALPFPRTILREWTVHHRCANHRADGRPAPTSPP